MENPVFQPYDGCFANLDAQEAAQLLLAPIDEEQYARCGTAELARSVRTINSCLRAAGYPAIAPAEYLQISLSVYDLGSTMRVEVFRDDAENEKVKFKVGTFILGDLGVMRCTMQ
jgi:hypothetical protein